MLLCKAYSYNIIWKGQRRVFLYYTNIAYTLFLPALFQSLGVPDTESENYDLVCGAQFIPTSFQIPFNGISEDIYVVKKKKAEILTRKTSDACTIPNSQVQSTRSSNNLYIIIIM